MYISVNHFGNNCFISPKYMAYSSNYNNVNNNNKKSLSELLSDYVIGLLFIFWSWSNGLNCWLIAVKLSVLS